MNEGILLLFLSKRNGNSKEKKYLIIQIICSFLPKKIPQDQQQYYHCRNQKIHIVNHGYPPSVILSFNRMDD